MKDQENSSEVKFFDHHAHTYQQFHDKNLKLAGGDSGFFYQRKIDWIKKELGFAPKTILDFGCGTGRLTALLHKAYPEARVVGVEPSAGSLEVARKDSPQIPFFTKLSEVEGSFDLIVACGVFHHIPPQDRTGVFNELYLRLENRGKFFIVEHNPLSPLCRAILTITNSDPGAFLLTKSRLTRELEGAGWQKTSARYISFFPKYLKALLFLEDSLKHFALGAQYLMIAQKRVKQ